MKRVFIILAFVVAFSSFANAQTPVVQNDEQAIRQLESELTDALLKGDAAPLDRALTDDWFITNPDTSHTSKSSFLNSVRVGPQWASIKDDANIGVYGNAAVVVGQSTRTFKNREGSLQFRFTRIYTKRDGRWMMVGVHVNAPKLL